MKHGGDDEPDGRDPIEDYSEADLDVLADEAADRYYATDFDPHDGFPYPR